MNNIVILPFSNDMIDSVIAIETLSFSEPWSRSSFESTILLQFQRSFAALIDGKVVIEK